MADYLRGERLALGIGPERASRHGLHGAILTCVVRLLDAAGFAALASTSREMHGMWRTQRLAPAHLAVRMKRSLVSRVAPSDKSHLVVCSSTLMATRPKSLTLVLGASDHGTVLKEAVALLHALRTVTHLRLEGASGCSSHHAAQLAKLASFHLTMPQLECLSIDDLEDWDAPHVRHLEVRTATVPLCHHRRLPSSIWSIRLPNMPSVSIQSLVPCIMQLVAPLACFSAAPLFHALPWLRFLECRQLDGLDECPPARSLLHLETRLARDDLLEVAALVLPSLTSAAVRGVRLSAALRDGILYLSPRDAREGKELKDGDGDGAQDGRTEWNEIGEGGVGGDADLGSYQLQVSACVGALVRQWRAQRLIIRGWSSEVADFCLLTDALERSLGEVDRPALEHVELRRQDEATADVGVRAARPMAAATEDGGDDSDGDDGDDVGNGTADTEAHATASAPWTAALSSVACSAATWTAIESHVRFLFTSLL